MCVYFSEHARAQYHLDSIAQAEEFLVRHIDPSKDIDRLLLVADETQQAENRKILVNVVRCLLFLAKQNIALRGDDDDGIPELDNRSQGNFRNLILFRIEAGDSVLDKHLTHCSKNATYLSPSELRYALSFFVHSGAHATRRRQVYALCTKARHREISSLACDYLKPMFYWIVDMRRSRKIVLTISIAGMKSQHSNDSLFRSAK